jgi:hypothetical protein
MLFGKKNKKKGPVLNQLCIINEDDGYIYGYVYRIFDEYVIIHRTDGYHTKWSRYNRANIDFLHQNGEPAIANQTLIDACFAVREEIDKDKSLDEDDSSDNYESSEK